jgi:hypothetical protein
MLLCNFETWTLKASTKEKLLIFEMGCLRRIKGVTRRDPIRNVDIRKELKLKIDLVQRIQRKRLRYFGYVNRMTPDRLPHIALFGHVHGEKLERTTRKRWINNLREYGDELGKNIAEACRFAASDREVWRSSVLRLSEYDLMTSSGHLLTNFLAN